MNLSWVLTPLLLFCPIDYFAQGYSIVRTTLLLITIGSSGSDLSDERGEGKVSEESVAREADSGSAFFRVVKLVPSLGAGGTER
jgi:hypothetical protein